MANLSMDVQEILKGSCHRHVVFLFKEVLTLLEQLAEEHDESLAKLATNLPEEYRKYIPLADYFTEDKADRLRRSVLQRGNDCARAIRDEIDKYKVDLKM